MNSSGQTSVCNVCNEPPPCTQETTCKDINFDGSYCETACSLPPVLTDPASVFNNINTCSPMLRMLPPETSGETSCMDENGDDKINVVRTYTLEWLDVDFISGFDSNNDPIVTPTWFELEQCVQNIELILGACCTNGTAEAGDDLTICEDTSVTLTGSTIGGGATTGTWSISSGPLGHDGSVTGPGPDSNPADASFSATTPGDYTLTLMTDTPSGGCSAGSDTRMVTVDEQPSSEAGMNQTQCNSSMFTLAATAPSVGTGMWTVVSGTGSVTTPSSNISGVTGVNAGTTTVLRWTVTNGECTDADEVRLTNHDLPAAPISGGNQTECETSPTQTLTATATVPRGSTIEWFLAASGGPAITGSPTQSTVGSTTYYAESIDVSTGCRSLTRTAVTLTINGAPAAPTSGGDQTECETNPIQTLTATASAPTGSTIEWFLAASGGVAITGSPTQPTVGNTTYYAESVNTTTGCRSLTRTAVTLTINEVPTITGILTICADGSTQLTRTGDPAPNTPWTSSDTGVATVSNTGLVTGVAAGTTTITFTDANGCDNSATITVNPVPTITGEFTLCVGESSQLTGSGSPAPSSPWDSENTDVVTVSNSGLITGVGPGTTMVTYTDANGCDHTATITVNLVPTISGGLMICADGSTQLTGSGNAASSTPWVSSNTGVATVSNTGLVTSVGPGMTTITYTEANGCDITATITVNECSINIVKGSSLDLGTDGEATVGDIITYTYVVTNDGQVTLDDVSVSEVQLNFSGTGLLPSPVYVANSSTMNSAEGTLQVGESARYTAMYAITAADIASGQIDNQAVASGMTPDDMVVMDDSDSSNPNDPNETGTPGDPDGDDPTGTLFPGISIIKGLSLIHI